MNKATMQLWEVVIKLAKSRKARSLPRRLMYLILLLNESSSESVSWGFLEISAWCSILGAAVCVRNRITKRKKETNAVAWGCWRWGCFLNAAVLEDLHKRPADCAAEDKLGHMRSQVRSVPVVRSQANVEAGYAQSCAADSSHESIQYSSRMHRWCTW